MGDVSIRAKDDCAADPNPDRRDFAERKERDNRDEGQLGKLEGLEL